MTPGVLRLPSDALLSCAQRQVGPGRTVWLASYPKSGNTWLRAIVRALKVRGLLFSVDRLGSGAQPNYVTAASSVFGLDPRWLERGELDTLRDALVQHVGRTSTKHEASPSVSSQGNHDESPELRKTHELYRGGSAGRRPFPLAATRAAIVIVRDPRDVVCSYAPFFGVDLDTAVEELGSPEKGGGVASPAVAQTAQPWGSWSENVRSWLSEDVPFPVHLVRFEDLKDHAETTLRSVFAAVGLDCTGAELRAAVEQARFERLRDSEAKRGFRETSPAAEVFFRKGAAGGWRDELTESQVAAVEADHGDMMNALGYEVTTDPAQRAALRAMREARRKRNVD